MPEHELIAAEAPSPRPTREFDDPEDESDGGSEAIKARVLRDRVVRGLARQVSMDPADGMEM